MSTLKGLTASLFYLIFALTLLSATGADVVAEGFKVFDSVSSRIQGSGHAEHYP